MGQFMGDKFWSYKRLIVRRHLDHHLYPETSLSSVRVVLDIVCNTTTRSFPTLGFLFYRDGHYNRLHLKVSIMETYEGGYFARID